MIFWFEDKYWIKTLDQNNKAHVGGSSKWAAL